MWSLPPANSASSRVRSLSFGNISKLANLGSGAGAPEWQERHGENSTAALCDIHFSYSSIFAQGAPRRIEVALEKAASMRRLSVFSAGGGMNETRALFSGA